jgi:dolichyl-phosphate-mannose-protein mannosyltransferase
MPAYQKTEAEGLARKAAHSGTLAVRSGTARQALLCFLGMSCIFLLTTNGNDNNEEADYSYRVAKQILTQRRISFTEPESGVFKPGPNGLYYESYEIGNSLFMLPMTWANERLRGVLTPRIGAAKANFVWRFVFACWAPVYCAAGLACIFLLLRTRFDQTLQQALLNVVLLGFCSYYWNFSRNLGDPVLCCALLCAATVPLFLYGRNFEPKLLILAFALLGVGLITRLTMAIPIVAAFLYLAVALNFDWKRLAKPTTIAAATLVPFVAWQVYYNYIRTGNVITSPLQVFYKSDNGLTGNLLSHLPALLISPGKGVLVFVPPALLALFCFPTFFRRYRAEAFYVATIGLGWLLFHSKLANNWYGAWGWGPRHFITVAPILVIPFLVCRSQVFSSRPTLVFARICLTFGFVLALSAEIGDWLYRLGFKEFQDHHATPLWSLTQNQAVDMMVSSARNLARLFTHSPYDVLPAASPMSQQASNTVNIWLVTAYHQGVPIAAIAVAAALLTAAAALAFWSLLQTKSRTVSAG